MKILHESDLDNVSGGSWWSPSNILDLFNSDRNVPAVATPGMPSIEHKPVNSFVGAMIGFGFLIAGVMLTAFIINRNN